jgi:hypothetical protein
MVTVISPLPLTNSREGGELRLRARRLLPQLLVPGRGHTLALMVLGMGTHPITGGNGDGAVGAGEAGGGAVSGGRSSMA